MKRFWNAIVVMLLLSLLTLTSGCASTGTGWAGWWHGKNSTSTTATTPAIPASNTSATTPQVAQQYAPPQMPAAYAAAGNVGGETSGGTATTAVMPGQNNGASTAASLSPAAGNYGGQKTCPVTGQVLGSMGPPVPVSFNGRTIYLCCEGCAAKFQQNPALYLDLVEAERNPGRSSANNSCAGCSSGGSSCASGCCRGR